MNKKGKNKKGKTVNPTPQKEKTNEKVEEVVADKESAQTSETIEEKSVSIKEERVPEIVSEVILLSINTKDEETPKKPKRNRGKKKKGAEDIDDKCEGDSKDTTRIVDLKENTIFTPVEEKCLDIMESVKDPQEDTRGVTPTARKNKKKKKNVQLNAEDPILPVLEQISPEENICATLEELQKQETKEDIIIDQTITEQDAKSFKKKNKKKKQNDSDRSDKDDSACTTAFKKLLDVQEEKVKTKMEESIDHTEFVKTENEIIQDTLVPETIKEKEMTTLQEATSLKDVDTQRQSHPTENKSKKHKKKDKRDIQKETDSVIHDERLPESINLPVDEITEDAPIVETPETENIVQKHKTKIAKPVEKKRKEKQESTIIDTPEQKEIISEAQAAIISELELTYQNIISDNKLKERETSETCDLVSKEIIETVAEDLSKIVDIDLSQPKDLRVQDVEAHHIQDKSAGKKRKKGPKIPRAPDVSFEIIEPKVSTNLLNIKTDDIKENLSKSTDILSISATEVSVTKGFSHSQPEVDTLITAESTKVKEHILLTPEVIESKDAAEITILTSGVVEKDVKTETKSITKRQKSPKPPKKAEMKSQPAKLLLTEHDISIENTVLAEEPKNIEANEDRSNITKLYDIEINTINIDESEVSTSDAIPDITYPRSSSQQLPDDNNNSATIREIFPILEISPDSPKQHNIKALNDDEIVKETKEFSAQKMEKTDLKSKMLEVNQDMEELRLSIERSLAEFTSIEKDEAVAEKEYDKSKLSSIDNIKAVIEKIENKGEIDPLSIMDDKQSVEKAEQQVKNPARNENNKMKLENIVTDLSSNEPKKTNPVYDVRISQSTSTSIAEKLTETLLQFDTKPNNKNLIKRGKVEEIATVPTIPIKDIVTTVQELEPKDIEVKDTKIEMQSVPPPPPPPPICPSRKDQKNKNKKKKGKLDTQITTTQPTQSIQSTTKYETSTSTTSQESKQGDKNEDTKEEKSQTEGKGKQQACNTDQVKEQEFASDYEPIENFEDALTSSVDDVNQSFEMIVTESQDKYNPKINIIAPDEEKPTVKPSKNLLGHPDIPVRSSKRDYKKEKDKIPNEICAKVKIKDSVEIDGEQTKNTQTINKLKDLKYYKTSENEEFVYKYNFRKVFLQNTCQVCKKDLCASRVSCCYCNLVFYCGIKHKDEDWPQHQALCFAVSTIGHLKDQKHIYADAKNISGHDYRLIRMQMIVSCEKILKRRLVPWEQEALLYPRMCAYVPCREWRQMKLTDCQGCAQISFCTDNPDHYPKSHSRWCKSYSLYQKLVSYQQTKGRLEPKLPTKVMQEKYEIPDKINEVLAGMYEEKIDMNDIQYAALTQLATAPLTAAYCHQLCCKKNIAANGYKSCTFVIHVVGAELQFEADALNKWEVFFLHLRPDLQHLNVVLINSNLNPSKLPLDLLGKIKLCESCRQKKCTVAFSFEERSYMDYKNSEDFILPDIVCAFNPSIQRSSAYNGKDPWPSTVNVIIKQKIPFLITAYTLSELQKDCARIKECIDRDYNFILEPKYNIFASVRPDRNFISDDEMPLLFKNYCFAVICG